MGAPNNMTDEGVRRRLMAGFNVNGRPVGIRTMMGWIPNAKRAHIIDIVRRMSNDGTVVVTGKRNATRYSLAVKDALKCIWDDLWRRDPVFTELHARGR